MYIAGNVTGQPKKHGVGLVVTVVNYYYKYNVLRLKHVIIKSVHGRFNTSTVFMGTNEYG